MKVYIAFLHSIIPDTKVYLEAEDTIILGVFSTPGRADIAIALSKAEKVKEHNDDVKAFPEEQVKDWKELDEQTGMYDRFEWKEFEVQ